MSTTVSKSSRRVGRPPTLPAYVMSEDEIRDIPFDFKQLEDGSEVVTVELTGKWVNDQNNPNRWVFCQAANRVENTSATGSGPRYSYWPQFTDAVATLEDGTRVALRIQCTIDGYAQGRSARRDKLPVTERKDLVGGQPDERTETVLKATESEDAKVTE